MAGVFARGPGKKWRFWYTGPTGKRVYGTGHYDRKATQRLADELDQHARRERDGLVEPGERTRRAAAAKPLADHLLDWQQAMLAKLDKPRHAQQQTRAAGRLLSAAGITTITETPLDRLQTALGKLRASRSPRTCNHALGAVKAFLRWLHATNRIKDLPRGIMSVKPYSEQVDRKRVRRALTADELDRLCNAAHDSGAIYVYGSTKSKHNRICVSGLERALIYRVAAGTGFRAAEIRSLRVASVTSGESPTITVEAAYSKNKKTVCQPITKELAQRLGHWSLRNPPDDPLFTVPTRTAQMFRQDLERAGIPYETPEGVADFHSLRHTYITNVVNSGANVKQAQTLARHSTPSLTIGIYAKADEAELRKILEGEK